MSSYLVSEETINAILSIDNIDQMGYSSFDELLKKVFGTINKNVLGKKMLKLNIEALKQRYPKDTDKTRPGTQKNQSSNLIAEKYSFNHLGVSLEQSYMSLQCLQYQCSEGNVPKKLFYKKLLELSNKIAHRIAFVKAESVGAQWTVERNIENSQKPKTELINEV